ncbi:hypothetical protein roselon_02175 [Roseibacterium elongatum DSM 19469]|uniref:Uncharacterized protein n=1 Tax=Roseicyclus elongatus DSM 19469 TaxID=1294273 RepID=W8RTL3_9RHOB|nr:hypothetical protein roselon_02175 [Roseibacterium elongatum DSM 19469]
MRRAFERALARTGDPQAALAELDRLQHIQLSRERPDDMA